MDTYEKKYKEAQKWIESIYPNLSHEQQMEAEAFFSELCESKDEKIRKRIIALVNAHGQGMYKDDMLAWLEKQGEQEPWSEEDEKIYSRIYNLIHAAAFENYDVDEDGKELGEYAKITDWLKSLKDKYTWKPSDEQMKALHDLNLTGNISYVGQGQVLIGLYNDLKKLKGG